MEIVLVFSHHLFAYHSAITKERAICFVEHFLLPYDKEKQWLLHKQKIMFHRASMKHFAAQLQKKGYKTLYFDCIKIDRQLSVLQSMFKKLGISTIHIAELDDFFLEKRIKALARFLKIPIKIHPSLGFLTPASVFAKLFASAKHYLFQTFYIQQRKNLEILLNEQAKPKGGKWSFDSQNRKKASQRMKFPSWQVLPKSLHIKEAKEYVEKHFSHHYGTTESFSYPTTHKLARKHLETFLQSRLKHFGAYEDAMVQHESTLFHSVLSRLLNSGLLTPQEVVSKTLFYAASHQIPLNSLEGFLRQIVGWREFIRGVYRLKGTFQRKANYFCHKRKMPSSFYKGTTGILPIEACIEKLQKRAYLHHIERLMIFWNFFLLCEIDPNEVYQWFMEMFIDAYDWVMVPNVYGMSQYADGGLMVTKPYFSSSHYILKMSNYPKGEWTIVWDALFWRFMCKHLTKFEKQPRLRILCNLAKKKAQDHALLQKAEKFLESLS